MAVNDNNRELQKEVSERVRSEAEAFPVVSDNQKIDSSYILQCLECQDLGDGLLFARLNIGKFVFNSSSGEWLKYTGHYWQRDEIGEVRSAIEETVVNCYLEELARISDLINQALREKDSSRQEQLEGLRKKIIKRIDRLRTSKGRESCLEFARTCGEASLVIMGDRLDSDPWVLGCVNGVVELRSGKFRPGDPKDLITKVSPVEWSDFNTVPSVFEEYLFTILGEDNDLYLFMQRLLGYSMLGTVVEHIVVVLFGLGRNGKGTLAEILKYILGPLCRPIPSEMLLVSKFVKSAAGPSPDVMMLRGLRVAYASETDENNRFSMNAVKQLSGGDSLTARNPHDKHPVTFQPSHKLFLLTNWKPQANADDFGFWERLVFINFPFSFVDRAPTAKNERRARLKLIDDLKAEASGILAWLVRGCLAYQKEGLNPPQSVREATASYRRDEDLLGDFIAANCTLGDHLKEQAKNLYDRFATWFEDEISKKNVLSQRRFGMLMQRRFNRIFEKGRYFYQGLELIRPGGS